MCVCGCVCGCYVKANKQASLIHRIARKHRSVVVVSLALAHAVKVQEAVGQVVVEAVVVEWLVAHNTLQTRFVECEAKRLADACGDGLPVSRAYESAKGWR